MHGGSVRASSDGPGCGSEFQIALPIRNTSETGGDGPCDPKPSVVNRAADKVLIVDDNADSADTLATLLRLFGHHVQVSYDGPSGLSAAQTFEPSVVLLDIGLPGLDGYAVASRLRECPQTRQAMLIAISGYGQHKDEQRSRQAGFDYHLVKPVEFNALRALLATRRETPRRPCRPDAYVGRFGGSTDPR